MLVLCVVFAFLGIINAHPYSGFRPRRSYPHQAMVMSGYYGRPNYLPQGSMTAFANRDTVMSNAFSGMQPGYVLSEESSDDESLVQRKPEAAEATESDTSVQEEDEELPVSTTTTKPKKVSKRKRPVKPVEVDEEDDDEGSWPLQGSRGVPSYNAFFPIMIGGGGSRGSNVRSGEYDSGYPGSSTAIANSFSTGKGGVASSHAVAYGDPYLSMLLRNGGGFKRKNLSKNQD